MLVAWGCRGRTNTVSGHEISASCTVVLGRARVASNCIDLVAMRAVERDDRICRDFEGCSSFVFHEDGMKIATKAVAEEEEAGEAADGWRMDRASIIDGKLEPGRLVWTPVPEGMARRLRLVMEHTGQSRCCEYAIDGRRG